MSLSEPIYQMLEPCISVADSAHQDSFPNERLKATFVDVAGDQPSIHSVQDVAHGELTYCYLREKKIEHKTLFTRGGHNWMNARHSLAETLQLYFK